MLITFWLQQYTNTSKTQFITISFTAKLRVARNGGSSPTTPKTTTTITTTTITWRCPSTTMSEFNLRDDHIWLLSNYKYGVLMEIRLTYTNYPQSTTVKIIAISTPDCIISIPRIIKLQMSSYLGYRKDKLFPKERIKGTAEFFFFFLLARLYKNTSTKQKQGGRDGIFNSISTIRPYCKRKMK